MLKYEIRDDDTDKVVAIVDSLDEAEKIQVYNNYTVTIIHEDGRREVIF